MTSTLPLPQPGLRVLVPGGTGAVGEGIVRAFLAAGADVVVPSRTEERSAVFRELLGDAASDRLHLVVHDASSFAGAKQLVATMVDRLGGIDVVLAPVGGWWAGGPLTGIEEADWQDAFVDLATTHLAIARAAIPRLSGAGFYGVVVGQSAEHPVPGSGLVSMEQAALLMMQRVLAAESDRTVHALVLGPVRTRVVTGEPAWISAHDIGAVAVALSAAPGASRTIDLPDADAATRVLHELAGPEEVVTTNTFVPRPGQEAALTALLEELQQRIRTEPGNLEYSLHPAASGDDGAVLVVQRFASAATFRSHAALVAELDGPRRLADLIAAPLQPPRLFAA